MIGHDKSLKIDIPYDTIRTDSDISAEIVSTNLCRWTMQLGQKPLAMPSAVLTALQRSTKVDAKNESNMFNLSPVLIP